MNAQIKNKVKGFTIIEVVLVLAIAGLIFLMVFIALPALQRSQRDQARKNDASIISGAVTSFTSNNRGTFPDKNQLATYVTDKSDNTTEVNINGTKSGPQTVKPDDGIALVTQQTTCGTSTPNEQTLEKGTARQFTVVLKLESGSGSYFCLGN